MRRDRPEPKLGLRLGRLRFRRESLFDHVQRPGPEFRTGNRGHRPLRREQFVQDKGRPKVTRITKIVSSWLQITRSTVLRSERGEQRKNGSFRTFRSSALGSKMIEIIRNEYRIRILPV